MSSLSASKTTPTPGITVRVENLSITYRTTFERIPTFKSAITRAGRGQRSVKEIRALQNVTFDVPDGTFLGIIGSNGAGKSTLMRSIAGILPPNEGRIEVNGRISPLLSLGVGFNANLSGRENIILGGLASGLSRREVEDRSEAVTEFAGIEEFIDAPMRTYSSGMYSRLAFSVAVHMDPDILMIDEALSAGDASFKTKAAEKMQELRDNARAMFLVSHSMASITQLCNSAIWLNKGQLMMQGEPQEVINKYNEFLKVGPSAVTLEDL
ncbi:MAG: ABC transporter ATP-binding protein [Knoellia sp.]